MSCGHELTEDEIIVLTEQLAGTSRPIPTPSGKNKKQTIAEIKELPARTRKKQEQISHNITKQKNSKQ